MSGATIVSPDAQRFLVLRQASAADAPAPQEDVDRRTDIWEELKSSKVIPAVAPTRGRRRLRATIGPQST